MPHKGELGVIWEGIAWVPSPCGGTSLLEWRFQRRLYPAMTNRTATEIPTMPEETARLMRQAGSPTDLQPVIVARAQQVLAATPYSDPTKRLTIALFLSQLGAEPGISVDAALSASRIAHIARGPPPALPAASANPSQRLAASLHLYALVHEIIALTDFGRQPPPDWLESRLEPLNRFLLEAIAWAGRAGNVDLLSELLLSARFLDAPLQEILPDALQQLLAGQQDDGSWGAYETHRPNKLRHAVFTATAALWSHAGAAPE